jgi:hypothetical protein
MNLFGSLNDIYTYILLFEKQLDNAKKHPERLYVYQREIDLEGKGRPRFGSVAFDDEIEYLRYRGKYKEEKLLPDEQLLITCADLHSPGFFEALGKLNPLEVLRQYLIDEHERKKDMNYRNKEEEMLLQLENQARLNKVIKEKIEILRSLDIDEAEIREVILKVMIMPMERFTNAIAQPPVTGIIIQTISDRTEIHNR